MKLFYSTFFLLFNVFTAYSTSTPDTTQWQMFLHNNYVGGPDAFLKDVFKKIHYPNAARDKCRVGSLQVYFELNRDGSLKQIEFKNELGIGIEKSVSKGMKKIEGNWIEADSIRKQEFRIAFRIGEKMSDIMGDLIINAYPEFNTGCVTSAQLKAQLDQLITDGKFRKAKKLCVLLKHRNPDSRYVAKSMDLIEENL